MTSIPVVGRRPMKSREKIRPKGGKVVRIDTSLPPFPTDYRASGLLLHVTALPSPYGIGDLGPEAYAWIDHLNEAGQRWWQALPLGPTGFGDSPYQPLSSFAGNTLLISPDLLIEDGLLQPDEFAGDRFPASTVDYDAAPLFKERLLASAWDRFAPARDPKLHGELERFRRDHARWLEEYALFHALKAELRGGAWLEWPAALARREPAALDDGRRCLAGPIDRVAFEQFLLFRQGERLRGHAPPRRPLDRRYALLRRPRLQRRLGQPGPVPARRAVRRPRFVAGVPPDDFSADGQLWGNPVYDWEAMGHGLPLVDRPRCAPCSPHVDLIRLDHFRGFAAAWHVRAGASTARAGQLVAGPGADFFDAVQGGSSAACRSSPRTSA